MASQMVYLTVCQTGRQIPSLPLSLNFKGKAFLSPKGKVLLNPKGLVQPNRKVLAQANPKGGAQANRNRRVLHKANLSLKPRDIATRWVEV